MVQLEIIIDCVLPKVTELFDDQDNYRLWQPTLISSRVDGLDNDKSMNYYEINGRIVEVQIIILENKLPQSFKTHVQMQGLTQYVQHVFCAHSANQTKWTIEMEFEAKGFFMRFILKFLPNVFRRRIEIYMQDFKKYAEKKTDLPNVL